MRITANYRRKGYTELDRTRHTHTDQYEIIQVQNHGGNVLVGSTLYPMTAGGLYLIHAEHIHMTNPEEADTYVRSIVKFSIRECRALLDCLGAEELSSLLFGSGTDADFSGRYIPLSGGRAEEADAFFFRLSSGRQGEASYRSVHILLDFLDFISECADHAAALRPAQTGDRITTELLKLIEAHSKEKLTLDRLSGMVNVSKFHMCRVFQKDTDMTISAYITLCRLSAVRKLLTETTLPIAAAAQESGFSSYPNFCAVFRKYVNMTPNEYRKRFSSRE